MTDSPIATARMVVTTAPDLEVAERIALALVEAGLAACVNLVPGVTSIYRWQGGVERAAEILMLIKTTAAAVSALEAELKRLHPYEVPEFLVINPEAGSAAYLGWLFESVRDSANPASPPGLSST